MKQTNNYFISLISELEYDRIKDNNKEKHILKDDKSIFGCDLNIENFIKFFSNDFKPIHLFNFFDIFDNNINFNFPKDLTYNVFNNTELNNLYYERYEMVLVKKDFLKYIIECYIKTNINVLNNIKIYYESNYNLNEKIKIYEDKLCNLDNDTTIESTSYLYESLIFELTKIYKEFDFFYDNHKFIFYKT